MASDPLQNRWQTRPLLATLGGTTASEWVAGTGFWAPRSLALVATDAVDAASMWATVSSGSSANCTMSVTDTMDSRSLFGSVAVAFRLASTDSVDSASCVVGALVTARMAGTDSSDAASMQAKASVGVRFSATDSVDTAVAHLSVAVSLTAAAAEHSDFAYLQVAGTDVVPANHIVGMLANTGTLVNRS